MMEAFKVFKLILSVGVLPGIKRGVQRAVNDVLKKKIEDIKKEIEKTD